MPDSVTEEEPAPQLPPSQGTIVYTDAAGQPLFPNGLYTIAVTVYDAPVHKNHFRDRISISRAIKKKSAWGAKAVTIGSSSPE